MPTDDKNSSAKSKSDAEGNKSDAVGKASTATGSLEIDDEKFLSWQDWLPTLLIVGVFLLLIFSLSRSGACQGTCSQGFWLFWRTFGVSLFIGGAAMAIGIFAGFLFGIPHSSTRPVATAAAGDEIAGPSSYTVNTNLEKISDWLTTIIVGVGLVELTSLPDKIMSMADYLASAYGEPEVPSAAVIVIVWYFGVIAFMLGYLWARLNLASELLEAEREARERPEFVEGLIHAFLYKPRPESYQNALKFADKYRRRYGESNDRVWTYIACAYGQMADYLKNTTPNDEAAFKKARLQVLDAVDTAIRLNPASKTVLKSVWDKDAQPGEDDLRIFRDDAEFAEKFK